MTIPNRESILGSLFVNSVSYAGIVQLGDCGPSTLRSKALAVQRAIPVFDKDEFRFSSYPIYFLPHPEFPARPLVSFESRSFCSDIGVDSVYTLGVSESSLLRVGSGGPVRADSRIKNIRHFNNSRPFSNRDIR